MRARDRRRRWGRLLVAATIASPGLFAAWLARGQEADAPTATEPVTTPSSPSGEPSRATGPTSASSVASSSSAAAAASAPMGLVNKGHLTEEDYARKKEGGYFTGLPLANYDPTTRFGFGGRIYYYYDGHRDDPLFAYTPYLHRLILQGFASTAGAQDHLLDYDAPNFLHTLFRARATLEFEAADAWPYYGTGLRSMAPLSFPGAAGTFAKASDYERAKSAVQPDGTTYGRFNQFRMRRPTLQLGLERLFLGGALRPFIGVGFSYNAIHDYTGENTDAVGADGSSVRAPDAPTLLARDCAAGLVTGCDGGFDNVIRLAISYDTRDLEPDPNSGVYAEFSNEIATKLVGSKYTYLRTMLSVRAFVSPFPRLADLVLAWRGVYEVQSQSTPFFSQALMPFIDDNHAGLGGVRTLRGFTQNRFVGSIIALTNYELRWTFTHVHLFKQDFALLLVPFLDIGRVFENVSQTTLRGWKRSQGAGFRVAWNEATVIAMDYGFSDEDSGLYVNFNHIF